MTSPSGDTAKASEEAWIDRGELAQAILTTTQRRKKGMDWVPQTIGEKLHFDIAHYTAAVPGLIWQMLRAVRLMHLAEDDGDYIDFLHARLPALRDSTFKEALWQAASAGRLRGIATLADNGVRFDEPELYGRNKKGEVVPYTLSFWQLAIAGAFLDIVNNMLGFVKTAELIAPMLEPRLGATTLADTHATVRSAVDGFVRDRTDLTEHANKQEALIKSFIDPSGTRNPALVTDAAILGFWEEIGSQQAGLDGFRKFRDNTRRLMFYRECLLLDRQKKQGEGGARSIDQAAEFGGLDIERYDAVRHEDDEEADRELDRRFGTRGRSTLAVADGEWRSPLARLLEVDDGSIINWLVRTEIKELAAIVQADGDRIDVDDTEAEDNDAEVAGVGTGPKPKRRVIPMFAWSPPVDELFLTQARYRWFGEEHGKVIQAVRDRANNPFRFDEKDGYAYLRDSYAGIAKKVHALLGAVAWRLIQQRRVEGLLALRAYDLAVFNEVVAASRASGEVQIGGDPASIARLLAIQLDKRGNPLAKDLRAAADDSDRAGLSARDAEDPDIQDRLAEAVPALIGLDELARNAAHWIKAATAGADRFELDRERFHGRFLKMYGGTD